MDSSTLEEQIVSLQRRAQQKDLSIREILQLLSGKGRPLVLVLLSLPFCQPIQIPGFSTPFGLAIAFFGLRMAFGKRIWLPRKVLQKTVSYSTLKKLTDRVLYIERKLKHWIHPRWISLCRSSWTQVINGVLIFILGVVLALPLPIPLSNLAMAWPIFLIALGELQTNGVLIVIGYSILTLVGGALFLTIKLL